MLDSPNGVPLPRTAVIERRDLLGSGKFLDLACGTSRTSYPGDLELKMRRAGDEDEVVCSDGDEEKD
ncbi:hypothetical protein MY5147_001109 [Beauveria neobassiana]|uniref:Uncharacterized protein n=1 Tax=Beauveria bassiana D1-5 TaxID=1245745 RepID=A0A0A2W5R7_BEABA|nr:hypothetical protein BBAD15_g6349 [Beauveria bassiana D1-5]